MNSSFQGQQGSSTSVPTAAGATSTTEARTDDVQASAGGGGGGDCSKCVQWLASALKASRPRQLLDSMGGSLIHEPGTDHMTITTRPPRSRSTAVDVRGAGGSGVSAPLAAAAGVAEEGRRRLLTGRGRGRNLVATSMEGTTEQEEAIGSHASARTGGEIDGAIGSVATSDGGGSEGGSFGGDMRVRCTWCGDEGPEGQARAFVKGPDPVEVVLCANRLKTRAEVEEVLVHELVHVYDVRVRDFDLRKCQQLAYSEVRAAREAECFSSSRFTKSYCVRDRATVATQNMFPEEGKDCVRSIFECAMKDNLPFAAAASSKSKPRRSCGGGPSYASKR